MNKILKFTALAGFLALGVSANAQDLLGVRHAQADIAVVDFHDRGIDTGYGAGLAVNLPLTEGYDVLTSYGLLTTKFAGVRATEQAFGTSLVGYEPLTIGKLFASLDVGWDWVRYRSVDSTDSFTYGGSLGYQVEVGAKVTLTPSVSYHRAHHYESDVWTGRLGAQYPVTETIGLTVGVSYNDDYDWQYLVGLTHKF